jgi:uncharacterized RDD family membrane protein YckC
LSDHNPYAPPQAEVRDPPHPGETGQLASLKLRFVGAVVDAVISLLVTVPLGILTGYWQDAFAGNVDYVEAYTISLASFVAFAALHGYWLAKHGQTIGKRLVGTRIVNAHDEQLPGLGKLLGLRYGVVSLISLIPTVGSFFALIDVLLIFRADRRCVHDLIAGTKVINA